MIAGRWTGAAAVAVMLVVGAAETGAQAPGENELRHARAAFQMAESSRWRLAERMAEAENDSLLVKILRWLDYIRPETDATFGEIAAFIAENPQWPLQVRLARRAEEAMTPALSDQTVLDWFAKREPATVEGMTRLAAAWLAAKETAKARNLIRRAWIEGSFGARQERDFLKQFRQFLDRDDHVARLDRLLWEGRDELARRLLPRVDAGHRALAEARMALLRGQGNVDRLLAKVPAELQGDPGLQYERLRWRRRKGRDAAAREILWNPPPNLVRPDKWWNERAILVRRTLQEGYVSEAYRIAKDHRVSGGENYADAEWLAGWIALRLLGEAREALVHFTALHGAVRYPVSLARGAYWAGRAAEALADAPEAERWYRAAAVHPATFYGQLARARLKPGESVAFPAPAQPTESETEAFERHELTRAVRLLAATNQKEWLRPFLLALGSVAQTPGLRALTAGLAQAYGRPDLAIAVAKRANQDAHDILHEGYPTMELPASTARDAPRAVERALTLAVIRQESAFLPEAISRAGARGLMQLMPSTARKVAAQIDGANYSQDRLTSDPHLNIALGQAYLAHLLDEFDGSYVLALAGYNAGPARVRAWMKLNGDPREPSVDVVDWIEMIPFEETRDYVQRVLEGLQVYRVRLNGGAEVAQGTGGGLGR